MPFMWNPSKNTNLGTLASCVEFISERMHIPILYLMRKSIGGMVMTNFKHQYLFVYHNVNILAHEWAWCKLTLPNVTSKNVWTLYGSCALTHPLTKRWISYKNNLILLLIINENPYHFGCLLQDGCQYYVSLVSSISVNSSSLLKWPIHDSRNGYKA